MTAACPACSGAAALAEDTARAVPADAVRLHLPDVHCAACIGSVETALAAVPGVTEAQVNLSRKQVAVRGHDLVPDDLIAALAAVGHRAQRLDDGKLADRDDVMRDLLLRTGVAGFAMMNVMLLSVAVWSGAAGSTEQLFHLLSAAITVPAVVFAARPFFASALGVLTRGRLNMDVPIALAIILATLVSLIGALQGADRHSWFDAALALTFFLLIGRTLDHAGRSAARSAASDLAALNVPQAVLMTPDGQRVVAADSLRTGDVIRVKPGDRFPADGRVTRGCSDIDRSALTGESLPFAVQEGDGVAAGEVNLSGELTVEVLRAGRETTLSRLADMVATAEMQRTRFAGLADRAARAYAPVVHLLGLAAFIGWWSVTGDAWRSIDVAISVLVITCPCALGLAVPAVSVVATGRAFRKGLLITSRTALERLSDIDTVAFDKTGTLTTGTPRLIGPHDPEALAVAGALASGSSHPYSRALAAAAAAAGGSTRVVTEVVEHPGKGVEGYVDGRKVRLGRPGWVGTAGDGVALDRGTGTPMLFRFAETLRPGAEEVVARLTRAGITVAMLSGDSDAACRAVAGPLGIAEVHSAMTPHDKASWVRTQSDCGARVLMVGDGLNDTGALSAAKASVALGSGLDAARGAADVVLLSERLDRVADLLEIARNSVGRMRQNLWVSAGYNLIAVPVALLGFATPLLAALAMSLSSVSVSLNSLRRFQ